MFIFRSHIARFRCAVLLGLSVLTIHHSVVLAQSKSATDYTDEQLLAAGWSSEQIAEARASVPKLMPKKEEARGDTTPLTPGIGYVSVFENYVPFDYLPDTGWKEANDKVGEIGGWRSYARIVQDAAKLEAKAMGGDN